MKGEDVATGVIGGGAEAFSNPIELLKRRLNKWLTNNKEKKDLMDMYVRNVKLLRMRLSRSKSRPESALMRRLLLPSASLRSRTTH